jgi:hypothetical protein
MKTLHQLTPTPPMGWNSFDCYGSAARAEDLLANLDVMIERLKPVGYEYFVLDNGWFAEYDYEPGEKYPTAKHSDVVRINEYGLYQPSVQMFPDGLQPIIDKTHAAGLKFGIHIMRGISRTAVVQNTPIKGTTHRAADIADTSDICRWCHYNYGVNMDKPGAQEFYDSWVQQLADWGVDFIKADDITGFPREIEAVVKAIEKCGRDIVLSLSPGGQTVRERMDAYLLTNMLRTTKDIWDNRADLNKAFDKWQEFNDIRQDGFWLDMDMIPFGQLMMWSPQRAHQVEDGGKQELLSGKGFRRMSGLNDHQKYTFITMRALAASPLFMGGDLPTTDEFSFQLITNPDMIACNQNGVMGYLRHRDGGVEVWEAPRKGTAAGGAGWIGVFNRGSEPVKVRLTKVQLGLVSDARYAIRDIWGNCPVAEAAEASGGGAYEFAIAGDGVKFLAYELA